MYLKINKQSLLLANLITCRVESIVELNFPDFRPRIHLETEKLLFLIVVLKNYIETRMNR